MRSCRFCFQWFPLLLNWKRYFPSDITTAGYVLQGMQCLKGCALSLKEAGKPEALKQRLFREIFRYKEGNRRIFLQALQYLNEPESYIIRYTGQEACSI